VRDIENEEAYNIESPNYFNNKIEFGFVFPPEFDNQKQQIFLDNFKSNKFFSKYKYIENNQNFTYLNYEEYFGQFEKKKRSNETTPTYDIKQNKSNETTPKYNNTQNKSNETTPKYNNTQNKSNETTAKYNNTQNKSNETISKYNNTQNKSNETVPKYNITQNKDTKTSEKVDVENISNEVVNNEYGEFEEIKEYKIKIFNSEDEIESEKKKSLKSDGFDFYVFEFSSLTRYSLRYMYYDDQELYEKIREIGYGGHNIYFDTETFSFQSIINKSIIKMLVPNSQDFIISEKLLDMKGYSTTEKENTVQEFIPLFMIFYFVPCICNLLVILVIEKETKIKESLVIIGLKKSYFWLSWAIIYGIIDLFSSNLIIVAINYVK